MDIKSGNGYPSSALSNFAPHKFELDGVEYNSAEAALQGLKFKNFEIVKQHLSKLIGYSAKKFGSGKNWQETQTLYYMGNPVKRDSQEYQNILDKLYLALAKNEGFRKALLSTGDAILTHSIGRRKRNETVLTRQEFCSRLMWIRTLIKKGEI